MARRLELLSVLLALTACSSSSGPGRDGGDDGPLDGRDAHVMTDADAAVTPDGGDDVSTSDGGDAPATPDGGEEGGTPDGGPLACDEAPHDPVLGTAKLGALYRVVDSATLPVTSWLPVAAVDVVADGGVGLAVYGYGGDGYVHKLGLWPQLSEPSPANRVFDAVIPSDRTRQVITTPALASTQGQLLAGYRTIAGQNFVTGGVSLFDTAQPASGPRGLAAPGMESALGLGSYFLVGGDGLGAAGGARGVYGVLLADAVLQPVRVATYPLIVGEQVRPGLMAVTQNGVVVLGYYLDGAARHSLRLPAPNLLTAALSGGAPVDLADAPELTTADDVANIAALGPGVVLLHTRKVRGILPALGKLEHYALTKVSGGGTTVGAPAPVLSADDDACTVVSQLVPVTGGTSVIVGLWDRNGQRLVRLAPR